MPYRRAYERDLQKVAESIALSLLQHPDWKEDALALRDRLDALVDEKLTASNPASIPSSEGQGNQEHLGSAKAAPPPGPVSYQEGRPE